VPFAGGILAEYYCGGVIFDHPDELGSATTATDCTGYNVQERLYYPFGEFWVGAGSLGMHQEFAQLPDYDPETDQYNTPNRHYTPMGRWLTPDPSGVKAARLDDPQTWNMYAYVRNNPTTLTDPSGLAPPPPESPSSCVTDYGTGPCGRPPTEAIETGANTEDQDNPDVAPPDKAPTPDPGNKPTPVPPPTGPDGKPTPPPMPVPGCPTCGWQWNPDSQNPRGGTWGPKGWKGPNPPSGSWDPNGGHWDINDGKGSPVDHYDPDGNPITPDQAHPGNLPRTHTMWDRIIRITPGPIVKWGTAAIVIYIIVDEGSRVYPPRNFVPVP